MNEFCDQCVRWSDRIQYRPRWELRSLDGERHEFACGIHLQREIRSFADDGLAVVVTRLTSA